MRIKPKADVISSIKQVEKTVNGQVYRYFMADCGIDPKGKRIRFTRSTRAECIRVVNEHCRQTEQNYDALRSGLSIGQIADAVCAFKKLEERHINLSITTIIDDYIARSNIAIVDKKMIDAYEEYYNSFSEVQVMHRNSVKYTVGKFAIQMAEKMVSEVTCEDVLKYIDSLGEIAPKTWNNKKQYISAFFEWCAKKVRRYCVENPIADLERKQIPYRLPEFAKVKDVRAMFEYIEKKPEFERARLVTYFTLSFFCGMRREEIFRLPVEDVHLNNGSIFVRMPKGWTKGMSPRTFHIQDNAKRWLESVDWVEALKTGWERNWLYRFIKDVRDHGIDIPRNAGRHSFITYHVAKYCNPSQTEGIVGTSSKMRTTHYMNLVDMKAGEDYFSINPRPRQSPAYALDTYAG